MISIVTSRNLRKLNLLFMHLGPLKIMKSIKFTRYSLTIFDHKYYVSNSLTKENIFTGYIYFFRKGIWSGKKVNQYFDPSTYIESFPQTPMKSLFPFLHYLAKSSGINPVTSFDRRYLQNNPDLKECKVPLLFHFMKHKSIEQKLGMKLATHNPKWEIKVRLPRNNPSFKLPCRRIVLEIMYGDKLYISDSDSIERKNEIQVHTRSRLMFFSEGLKPEIDVQPEVNSDVIFIKIQSKPTLFLDIKWLRIILINYLESDDFEVKDFVQTLKFLLFSISNRAAKYPEVLGDKFAFSLGDYHGMKSNLPVNQIYFSDHWFGDNAIEIKKSKLILLVSHEDTYTGAPLYLLQIANYLRNNGFRVVVLCVRAKHRSGVFLNQGFETIYLEDLSNQQLLIKDWLLTELGKTLLTELLRNLAPHQIWVNSINASCVIELADRVNTSTCLFVHESFGFISNEYIVNDYEVLFHSALQKAHLVVFGSDFSKSSFNRNDLRSNGIVLKSIKNDDLELKACDLELRNIKRSELEIGPDTRVYLSMASFEPRKRINDIINAFDKIKQDNSLLILVGHIEGNRYSHQVKKKAESCRNVIVFPGTKTPSDFYSMSDVLILASESETYPLVLQDAIRWNLLRIVAKFPGYTESCDENTAQLFEVGDIEHLESLIRKSSAPLESMQKLQSLAKLDLASKKIDYDEQLSRIFKNLSMVNIGLESK